MKCFYVPHYMAIGVFCFQVSCSETSPYPGSGSDDGAVSEVGAWQSEIPDSTDDFYVRPAGEIYGTGDGSSWGNAPDRGAFKFVE